MVQQGTVDMFNIKLAKSGGLHLGRKIKAIADASNTPTLLGSMIESTLGMLADYHFARSQKIMCSGLSAYKLIKNQPDVGFRLDGQYLRLTEERPGLGYPDEEAFAREFKG